LSAGGAATGLAPLGLELNMRKTTVWGPGLVPATSLLAAATRLHLEADTEVLGVPIHSPLYHSPVGAHREDFPIREICPHFCGGGGPRRHPVRARAHAVLLGPR